MELLGPCAGFSPLHPFSLYLPQSPMGGQGSPGGHSLLTHPLDGAGYDQQL